MAQESRLTALYAHLVSNFDPALASNGLIVRPVLYWPPKFWVHDDWAETAREYQWVSPATPLAERPVSEFNVSLDVTLGEVLEAACDEWGIVEGPHMKEMGVTRASEFHRFGFVRVPDDEDGVDEQNGYKWPGQLQVAREDGSVDLVPAMDVTYRELLVSSSLGLIEGDVTRPYVYPVRPQGMVTALSVAAHLSGDAVRAIYADLDHLGRETGHVLRRVGPDVVKADAVAMTVVGHVGAYRSLRNWLRKRHK